MADDFQGYGSPRNVASSDFQGYVPPRTIASGMYDEGFSRLPTPAVAAAPSPPAKSKAVAPVTLPPGGLYVPDVGPSSGTATGTLFRRQRTPTRFVPFVSRPEAVGTPAPAPVQSIPVAAQRAPLPMGQAATAMGHQALSPIRAQLEALGARSVDQGQSIPVQSYVPQAMASYSPYQGIAPIGAVGPVGTASQAMAAMPTDSFFALNRQPGALPFMGMPAQPPMGQTAQQLLAQQPNLSPGMLGGVQNAGVMTDRLGNRIFAPVAGFATGGEVEAEQVQSMQQESDGEGYGDENGEARRMLMAMHRRRTREAGGAQAPNTLTMEIAPIPEMMQQQKQQPRTAKAELLALAKQLELKKKAYQDSAKGLQKDVFGAATLEQPALTKDRLSVKRFAKGGAARNA